jgi:hypothetical protein
LSGRAALVAAGVALAAAGCVPPPPVAPPFLAPTATPTAAPSAREPGVRLSVGAEADRLEPGEVRRLPAAAP